MENGKITRADGYSKLRELVIGESALRVPGAFLYSPANVSLFTTDAWMFECFRHGEKYLGIRDNTDDLVIKEIANDRAGALFTYVCTLKNII